MKEVMNLSKKIVFSLKTLFFAGTLLVFLALSPSAYAAIPQKGNIAIAVGVMSRHDATPYQMASVESMVVQELIARGYRPVRIRIRRDQERFFAAEDNVDAIRRLSSQYKVSTIITIRLRVYSLMDEFVGYEGGASMVLMATSSNGVRLYGGSISDRKIAHTPEEAMHKAMEAVVEKAVAEMTQ